MIIRGTTPYHSFILPLTTDQISMVYITYLQNNVIILDKSIEDIIIEDIANDSDNTTINEESEESIPSSQLTIHLTQEDTLKFHFYPAAEKNLAVIQIRILTTDGEAYVSKPITERIFGVLKDGVISSNKTDNNH